MRSIGEKVDEEGERDVDLWVARRGGVARDMEDMIREDHSDEGTNILNCF